MRDDSKRWPVPRDPGDVIEAPGLSVKKLHVSQLTLLSGRRALHQTKLPLVAWPDVVTSDSLAVVLRRDRVMEVNGPVRTDGWDNTEYLAISDVSDAYAQVELTGENALSLLRRGTELDPKIPSRSTARLCFGLGVSLYRIRDDTTFRLHVASAHDEALWHALSDAAKHLS
ncbi:MAG: hypothetical protein AAFZ10_16785 [Pseudomonadota bacterium]